MKNANEQENGSLLLTRGIIMAWNCKKESCWSIQFWESLKLGKVTHLKTLQLEHKTYPTWSFFHKNKR